MQLKSISLHNVRSHKLFSADIDPRLTLILGNNGSGKTTLLESIYIMLRGTSFRGRLYDLVTHGKHRGEIKLTFSSGDARKLELTRTEDQLKKEFKIGDKTSARLPATHRVPVVLFEPEELRLLTSSPQRRREFLDDIIVRLTPNYGRLLSRYERTLLQRNELLKQAAESPTRNWRSHLFAWDIKLAESASQIIDTRRRFLALCPGILSTHYGYLAGKNHPIEIIYETIGDAKKSTTQHIIALLEARQYSDLAAGHTTVGPHRDDFSIFLDKQPAATTASRGEMRTIMLAFKLLEVDLLRKQYDSSPIILMDDVFSELDITRERRLMETLKTHQTVITATDLRDELKINASIVNL